jgi:hypothetical protein
LRYEEVNDKNLDLEDAGKPNNLPEYRKWKTGDWAGKTKPREIRTVEVVERGDEEFFSMER